MKEMFSPNDVADILNVHVKTVRRYLKDGTLKGKKVGGSWVIEKAEVKHILPNIDTTEHPSEDEGFMKKIILKVNNQEEVDVSLLGNELMEVVNSNKFQKCRFTMTHFEGYSEITLAGNTDFLIYCLEVVQKYEG